MDIPASLDCVSGTLLKAKNRPVGKNKIPTSVRIALQPTACRSHRFL